MLLTLLVLLLPVNLGYAGLCDTGPYKVCPVPDTAPSLIPRNTRELLDLCQQVDDHVECLHSYDLACAGRSPVRGLEPPLYYTKIRTLLDKACDVDATYHKVLGRNLPCIYGRVKIRDLLCRENREEVLNAYAKYLKDSKIKRFNYYDIKDREECLDRVVTATCVLEDITKNCGVLASEVSSEAVLESQLLPDFCDLDIFQELSGIFESLEINKSLKRKTKEYFTVEIL